MSRIFDFATAEDAEGILEIMESDIAGGAIKLLYTRRDNPLVSYHMESSESVVGVVKNGRRVCATIACIPSRIYLEGEIRRLSYVTGYKKRKDESAVINWYHAFDRMYGATKCDLYYCSVVTDNKAVLEMLHSPRKRMPYAVPIDTYHTYIINPAAKVGLSKSAENLSFKRATKQDEKALIDFYRRCGKKRNFFPVIDSPDFMEGLDISDYYILYNGNEVVSAAALFDRTDCKQYIVKEYAGYMRFLRIFNPLLSLMGFVNLPKENTPFNFVYLSFFLAQNDDMDYYRIMLHYIMKAAAKKYSMIIHGVNEHNPKKKLFDKVRHISFTTQLNEVNLSQISGKPIPAYDKRNIEVDCASL